MIAREPLMPWLDGMFVLLTVFAIAISWSPDPTQRQSVAVAAGDGSINTYSLAIDDPRLTEIRRRIDAWKHQKPSAAIGIARWQTETAGFYAQRTAFERTTASPAVVPVSYTLTPSAPRDLVAYWKDVQQHSQTHVDSIVAAWQQRVATIGPPPIRLGDITAGKVSGASVGFALGIAVCGVIMMTVWTWCQPPRTLQFASSDPAVDRMGTAWDDVPIVMPAQWIIMRQPMAVQLRRFTYAGLFVLALARILMVDLP